ncbi:hypothetical protein V3C99_003769 [Haemonchus contortus]
MSDGTALDGVVTRQGYVVAPNVPDHANPELVF